MHWFDLLIYSICLIPLAIYIGYLIRPQNTDNNNKENK